MSDQISIKEFIDPFAGSKNLKKLLSLPRFRYNKKRPIP